MNALKNREHNIRLGALKVRYRQAWKCKAPSSVLAGLLSDALQPAFGIESLRYALLLVSLPVVGSVGLLIRTAGHAAQTHYVHAPQRA